MLPLSVATQIKVAGELAVNPKLNAVPEQTEVEVPLVIVGVWFTVTLVVAVDIQPVASVMITS